MTQPPPLTLYDTFSPTILRGKAALLYALGPHWGPSMALELGRAGARVAVCDTDLASFDAVLRQVQAQGRAVAALPPAGLGPIEDAGRAVAATVRAFGRIDGLVIGPSVSEALAPAGRLEAAVVNLLLPGGLDAAAIERRGRQLAARWEGCALRSNAVLLPPGPVTPQEAAWPVIFLLSEAAALVTGQCIVLDSE